MSDQYQTEPFHLPAPRLLVKLASLPRHLERRLLRQGEQVTWVRGPRFNPWWEPYVTHPALFLAALVLAAACLLGGWLVAGSWSKMPWPPVVAAGAIFIGSVYVLGISNAYFTRLVVTTERLLILQGHEICRRWRIDDLPRSLLRYAPRGRGEEGWSVDVDALQTMLGGASDQFADPKTIRSIGKQLDQIKKSEDDRR